MIRKILCPTDFSSHSRAGVASAISLAQASRAELVFFHATPFPLHELTTYCETHLIIDTRYIRSFTVDGLQRETESRLCHFVRAHFDSEINKLKWKPKVGLGKVAREIVAAACQEEVDLIVMGKRKRRLFQRFLSRSVSEAVSHSAPCPVLTVCPPQIIRPWRGKSVPVIGGVLQGSEA